MADPGFKKKEGRGAPAENIQNNFFGAEFYIKES